jgi:hypothetical protein
MKIVLRENQLYNLKKQLTEGLSDDYSRYVKVKFYSGNSLYKGSEINDIISADIKVTFAIEIEGREWGIKDVSLYGIRGPQEIEMEIEYVDEETNRLSEDVVMLNLDWDKLKTDTIEGSGMISVGDELNIDLVNDENGNLVIESMTMDIYSL